MPVRSSARVKKDKKSFPIVREIVDLENEASVSTASPTQATAEPPLPLSRETQQFYNGMPDTLLSAVDRPIGYDATTLQPVFTDGVETNGVLQPGSDDDLEPDDRESSETSNPDLVPIHHPEINCPSYSVTNILKMLGIKKDWENTTVVKAGEMFDLETTSKNILSEAFNIAEANRRPGCALNGLLAEVLSGTQAAGKGIKTTLAKVTNTDWTPVIDNIVYVHGIDKKKQIRVILVWNYYLKNLDRSDTLPGSIPIIKRTGEGVILIGDSPSRKKGKSGPSVTITQFTQAAATTATQQGLVASNLRQIQAEQQGRTFFRDILQRYHCQLTRYENATKVCISKGGRHFMLSQEAPKLWNDAIIAQEATIESFPVALFHLLTIQEPSGDRGRRLARQKDSSPTPSRSRTPAAPQFIMMPSPAPAPAPTYGLPPYHPAMAQHPWFPPPTAPGRGSSPPMPEDPADLLVFIAWFKLREPLNADAIEGCVAVLNQERDSLSTLETISEARIARHGLPAGLMARMKGSVKIWRRAAT